MYLIQNAEVYTPDYAGKQDILLCNDRIVEIGPALRPGISGLTLVDAGGKKAIPGLIDQHVHVTGGGGEGGFHTRTPELQLSEAIGAGVTTLVGLLGTDSHTRSVDSLVAKTKALQKEGLTAYCLTGAYGYPSATLTGSVARDIVFISEVIGCKLAMSDHRSSHPTKEEIVRLVSEIRTAAMIAGKPGVLHIHTGTFSAGIRPLFEILDKTDIPVWHFRPTHMGRHLDQAVSFTHRGGYADVTAEPEKAADLAAAVRAGRAEYFTLSSDSNGSMPVWNDAGEMTGIQAATMEPLLATVRSLVLEHGLPLEQALRFVTTNVARALQLSPAKGQLSPGSHADLVLLDSDLEVHSVFAGGRAMMLDKEILVRGTYEK